MRATLLGSALLSVLLALPVPAEQPAPSALVAGPVARPAAWPPGTLGLLLADPFAERALSIRLARSASDAETGIDPFAL
jgi:hypothetical protein